MQLWAGLVGLVNDPAALSSLGAGAPSSLGGAIDTLNQWILNLATSPWVLLAVFLVAWIDGFFPPVPSETLVVAAATAFAAAKNWPLIGLLPLVAMAGAMAGDLTAYSLGRFFRAGSWPVFRRGKGEAAFNWAGRMFARLGGPLIIVARYIPMGRVAVNLTAGSIRFPLKRFVVFDAVAGFTWGIYSTAFGVVAGHTLGGNPLLSVVIGIGLAVAVGVAVQAVFSRRFGRADLDQASQLAHQPRKGQLANPASQELSSSGRFGEDGELVHQIAEDATQDGTNQEGEV